MVSDFKTESNLKKLNWRCVDCGGELRDFFCDQCGRAYEEREGVRIFLPKNIDALALSEAEYHDSWEENAQEAHQLNSPRNFFYHKFLWDEIDKNNAESVLEIGTGSGFDFKHLKGGFNLVLSDISAKSLARARLPAAAGSLEYVACDGANLPWGDSGFDVVYMVATLHHFSDPSQVINEIRRVLKPGGKLVVGIEPNKFYFSMIKFLRKPLCALTHTAESEGSKADAEMVGFSCADFEKLFGRQYWIDLKIKPMWFFCGILHYLSEFLFRALKLKKRIVWPKWFENGLVKIDELIMSVPKMKHLCWHWIVTVVLK